MLKLKELRNEKNISQQAIAGQLGISRQVFANWENEINQPDLKMIILLADFFDVTTDYLLGRTDELGAIIPKQSGVPTVPGLGEISPMEKELVTRFRKLPAETQDYLLGITRNLTK